jgi:hypothetical protein
LRRLTVAAAACLAVATFVVAPSWVFASTPKPAARACVHGYSYGGYASRAGVRGVSASISAQRVPRVSTGHAAAWIGVGGIHEARGGAKAWLQAGIAAFPQTGLRLYVEEVSLGKPRRFVDLGAAAVGRSYRVEVVETAPDVWQASVDGRRVGWPAYLPTGGGSWRGVATAESWAGGRAACNSYGYGFERVSVLHDEWESLVAAQPIGRGVTRAGSGFSVASRV